MILVDSRAVTPLLSSTASSIDPGGQVDGFDLSLPTTNMSGGSSWNTTRSNVSLHAADSPLDLLSPWGASDGRGRNTGTRSEVFLFGFWKKKEEYLLLGSVVVVIMVASLLGNAMVCLVTAPKLKAGTAMPLNVLVLSLAVSEVMRVIFEMLPTAVEYLCLRWSLGALLCKVVSMLRCVFADFSMGTMALISVERYRSVDKPAGTSFTLRTLCVALLALCMWDMASSSPLVAWFDVVPLGPEILCTIPHRNRHNTALYTSITRVTNFFLPLTASWVGYMGVVHKTIKSRARVSHGISESQKTKRQRLSHKVTVTCVCLMTLFTISLSPFQLTLLVMEHGGERQQREAARCLKYVWLLSLLQSTANPFLYGLMWKNFRKSVIKLLQPFRKKNSVEPLFCQKPKVANPDESPRPEKQAATRASPEVKLSDSGSSTVSSNRSPLQSNNVEADTDPNGCMAVKTTNHKFAYKGAEVCGSSSDVGRPVHSAGNRPLTSDVRNLPKKCVKSTSQSRNTREVQTVETDLSAAQTKTCESKASEA